MARPDCSCFKIAPELRDLLLDQQLLELSKPVAAFFCDANLCDKALPYAAGALMGMVCMAALGPDYGQQVPLAEGELLIVLELIDATARAAKDRLCEIDKYNRDRVNASN